MNLKIAILSFSLVIPVLINAQFNRDVKVNIHVGTNFNWFESEFQDIYKNSFSPEIGFFLQKRKFSIGASFDYFHSTAREDEYRSYVYTQVNREPTIVPQSVRYEALNVLTGSFNMQYRLLDRKISPILAIEFAGSDGLYSVDDYDTEINVFYVVPKVGLMYELNERYSLVIGSGRSFLNIGGIGLEYQLWKSFLRLNYEL